MTVILDQFGMHLMAGVGYDGSLQALWQSGPLPNEYKGDWGTFLANVFFLQTVTNPVFGSNGPMWSLANEFWYYLTVPLAVMIVLPRTFLFARLVGAAVLFATLWLLPESFLVGAVVWFAGGCAGLAIKIEKIRYIVVLPFLRIFGIITLPVALITAKFFPGSNDIWLGLIVAGILPIWAFLPSFSNLFNRLSKFSADTSFTLYLMHFPLQILIVSIALEGGNQFSFSAKGLLFYFVSILFCLMYAIVFWAVFERRTNELYRFLESRFNSMMKLSRQYFLGD